MSKPSTDRIEKQITLRATRNRVWRALTDAGEFGEWFGVKLEGAFAVGARAHGKITYPGFEHLTMEVWVERIDPEHYFSFRWHPYAVEAEVDYSSEPTTLVEFTLSESADGTRLTIVESGFDKIPLARREKAFRMNDEGWSEQTVSIERHVAK